LIRLDQNRNGALPIRKAVERQLPKGTTAFLPLKNSCFAVTSKSGLSTLAALAATLTPTLSSSSVWMSGVRHTICPVQAINCLDWPADSLMLSFASLWLRFQRPSISLRLPSLA
jgi:hypothetical protein